MHAGLDSPRLSLPDLARVASVGLRTEHGDRFTGGRGV